MREPKIPARVLNCIAATCAAAAALLAGCIGAPQHPAATQPSTAIDLATTQPSYWLDQPAAATVSSPDFDTLWKACEDSARGFLFQLDRTDYRGGVLNTKPLVSGQWFEPWRRDARTVYEREESSIATIRRTIRFEFTRDTEGTGWTVEPTVLVERTSISEKRITSVVRYRNVFTAPVSENKGPRGSRESDQGIRLPERYWYPLRRDTTFETAIARDVRKRLDKSITAAGAGEAAAARQGNR